MTTDELFKRLIDAFMAKDLDTVMSCYADDALLVDPHYPVGRMKGREAIERGIRWGLSSLAKPGFSFRHSVVDGDIGFFELDTHHLLKIGMTLKFEQVFVVEKRGDKITRMQGYEPNTNPIPRRAWRD